MNIKDLANLTANANNYGQITLNNKPHSDPLKSNAAHVLRRNQNRSYVIFIYPTPVWRTSKDCSVSTEHLLNFHTAQNLACETALRLRWLGEVTRMQHEKGLSRSPETRFARLTWRTCQQATKIKPDTQCMTAAKI